jgi:hypothetical protein
LPQTNVRFNLKPQPLRLGKTSVNRSLESKSLTPAFKADVLRAGAAASPGTSTGIARNAKTEPIAKAYTILDE